MKSMTKKLKCESNNLKHEIEIGMTGRVTGCVVVVMKISLLYIFFIVVKHGYYLSMGHYYFASTETVG